ncbi:hypothetical protein F5X99DRAFT_208072 [Biscogniauxia marginata]|nr:hypothetical protein F5X99DRAFT_208072 [Biscogniauxia marginata]
MPDEDMEITIDLGQPGFGEDIDIDLDFVAGQVDEDMELGDFDQTQDIENFNSDTRDELMAEGDDASYGMIDADDVDHNEVAAAANDIEIDIGDPDEIVWQQSIPRDPEFNNTAEIDYVEDVATENAVTSHLTTASGDANWLEASADAVAEPVDHVEGEPANIELEVTASTSENLPLESTGSNNGVDFRDFGVSQEGEEASKPPDTIDLQENIPSDNQAQGTTGESHDTDPQYLSKESPDAGHYENDSGETNANQATIQNGENSESGIQGHVQDTDGLAKVVGAEDDQYGSNDATQEDRGPTDTVPSGNSVVPGDADQQEYDEQSHDNSELNASGNQLGGEPYTEPTNEQSYPSQDSLQAESSTSDVVNTTDPQDESGYTELEANDADGPATTEDAGQTLTEISHAEAPALVAARYEMYITYGRTDYRLFAKSEDDDPNQFFLNGLSALDLPLVRFLSSLREVISEEVSPLDELVMHVDGLGLEFSESSTTDFLEKYTFGDIISLYDKLVKNDDVESSPDLYTYLMVRPNCNQRLMALIDSANAGRGLSEIAVYRDSTPLEDEHVSTAGSQAPETSPDDEDEEANQSQEGDYEEDDSFDTTSEIEDGAETKSPSVKASTVEVTTEEAIVVQADSSTEHASHGANEGTAEELIDYSDEELDVSPSKQGKYQIPLNCLFSFPCSLKSDC